MNQNIAVICHKREVGKQVSSMLAAQLEMHFLDIFDLIEFDDKPRTLTETIEKFGAKQVRKHEASLISYISEFSSSVFSCESGVVDKTQNLRTLLSSSLLIYLHCSAIQVKQTLEKEPFKTKTEKRFFDISVKKIQKRIEKSAKYANIKINITGKSVFKITSDILREIKKFYNAGRIA